MVRGASPAPVRALRRAASHRAMRRASSGGGSAASALPGWRRAARATRWPGVRASGSRWESTTRPSGEVHSHTENPKGEAGYIIRSEGGAAPWRLKYRAPSFVNLQVLKDILPNHLLADIVAILGSIDFVMGECDK